MAKKRVTRQRKQTAIVHVPPPPERPWALNTDEVAIVKNSIAKGASDQELAFCLTVARRYKLDPFKQQIWFVKRWDKNADNGHGGLGGFVWTPQVGINGLLFMAARDHKAEFGSISKPEYGPMIEINKDLKAPEWASVKVTKKDGSVTEAVAYWEEYAPDDLSKAPFWRKMPRRMIGKCATSLTVKEAYPDLGGLYIPEETQKMQQLFDTDYTPEGRRIVNTEGFSPSGQPVTYIAQRNNSREAARAVLEEKLSNLAPKPLDAEIVQPSQLESKPSPSRGTVEIDHTIETSPIVRGDIGELLDTFQLKCKMTWTDDWWHILPRDAETIRQICAEFGFTVREITPQVAPPVPEQAAKPKTAPARNAPQTEPVLVSGTIEQLFQKMTTGKKPDANGKCGRASVPYLSILFRGTDKSKRFYSVFDHDLFDFLHAAKNGALNCELYVKGSGNYMNVVGMKKVGVKEFVDGKVPVIQQRDREAGGKTLFGDRQ